MLLYLEVEKVRCEVPSCFALAILLDQNAHTTKDGQWFDDETEVFICPQEDYLVHEAEDDLNHDPLSKSADNGANTVKSTSKPILKTPGHVSIHQNGSPILREGMHASGLPSETSNGRMPSHGRIPMSEVTIKGKSPDSLADTAGSGAAGANAVEGVHTGSGVSIEGTHNTSAPKTPKAGSKAASFWSRTGTPYIGALWATQDFIDDDVNVDEAIVSMKDHAVLVDAIKVRTMSLQKEDGKSKLRIDRNKGKEKRGVKAVDSTADKDKRVLRPTLRPLFHPRRIYFPIRRSSEEMPLVRLTFILVPMKELIDHIGVQDGFYSPTRKKNSLFCTDPNLTNPNNNLGVLNINAPTILDGEVDFTQLDTSYAHWLQFLSVYANKGYCFSFTFHPYYEFVSKKKLKILENGVGFGQPIRNEMEEIGRGSSSSSSCSSSSVGDATRDIETGRSPGKTLGVSRQGRQQGDNDSRHTTYSTVNRYFKFEKDDPNRKEEDPTDDTAFAVSSDEQHDKWKTAVKEFESENTLRKVWRLPGQVECFGIALHFCSDPHALHYFLSDLDVYQRDCQERDFLLNGDSYDDVVKLQGRDRALEDMVRETVIAEREDRELDEEMTAIRNKTNKILYDPLSRETHLGTDKLVRLKDLEKKRRKKPVTDLSIDSNTKGNINGYSTSHYYTLHEKGTPHGKAGKLVEGSHRKNDLFDQLFELNEHDRNRDPGKKKVSIDISRTERRVIFENENTEVPPDVELRRLAAESAQEITPNFELSREERVIDDLIDQSNRYSAGNKHPTGHRRLGFLPEKNVKTFLDKLESFQKLMTLRKVDEYGRPIVPEDYKSLLNLSGDPYPPDEEDEEPQKNLAPIPRPNSRAANSPAKMSRNGSESNCLKMDRINQASIKSWNLKQNDYVQECAVLLADLKKDLRHRSELEARQAFYPFVWTVKILRSMKKTPRFKNILLKNLKERNEKKMTEIMKIVNTLQDRQIALETVEGEKTRLENLRTYLVEENKHLESKLDHMIFPQLTDSDVELYFAGQNNPHQLYHIMQCCDARFQMCRKKLVRLYKIWKKVEESVKESTKTVDRINYVQSVHKELKDILQRESYVKDHKEATRLFDVCKGQQKLIQDLQRKILQNGGQRDSQMPLIDEIETIQFVDENRALTREINDLVTIKLPELVRIDAVRRETFEEIASKGEDVKLQLEEIKQVANVETRKKKFMASDYAELDFLRYQEKVLLEKVNTIAQEVDEGQRRHMSEIHSLRGILNQKNQRLRELTGVG